MKEVVSDQREFEVGHNRKTYSLITGIISLLLFLLFFLEKLQLIKLVFSISDLVFLWAFAILAVISSVVHFVSLTDF